VVSNDAIPMNSSEGGRSKLHILEDIRSIPLSEKDLQDECRKSTVFLELDPPDRTAANRISYVSSFPGTRKPLVSTTSSSR
jgi:hypothetical protein